jgi:hypothetical protein
MKHVPKALAVVAIMAMILAATISPASALKARGGVLLPVRVPCHATANAQNHAGAHLINNPRDRIQKGCWAELPPGANHPD